MRYSIIITMLLLIISSNEIIAQNVYDDFFLPFMVLEEIKEDDKIIAKAVLYKDGIIIDEETIGSIMPLYNGNSKKEIAYIGEVKISKDNTGALIIELENTEENAALLKKNKSLIKIKASLGNIKYKSLSYHMNRLNVKMIDVMEEKDLLEEYELNDFSSERGNELKILERLKEESEYVAGEMRGKMAAPKVEEGRFQPADIFTAMEMADSWDVRSFLLYVKEKPYKYQGTEWRFSEIFATWIVEGAPTTFTDLKELASMEWKEDAYLIRFFKDASLGFTKEVLKEIRSKAGNEIDIKQFGKADLLLKNATILSQYIDDEVEMAWTNYKKGKLLSERGNNDEAIIFYEKSMTSFEKEKEDIGILLVGNDLGYAYNQLEGKANYKKAITSLEGAIDKADILGLENETLSPVTGLMYRNLGDSYIGLKKYKKALELYKTGLAYTEFSTATALKRKSAILLKISEAYGLLENGEKEAFYLEKALITFKEYEAALTKVKNI